jgi:hypothetical protein
MIKLVDYKGCFRGPAGMIGSNAECYADEMLPKLRLGVRKPHDEPHHIVMIVQKCQRSADSEHLYRMT